ncbi:VWA domain-containing protein [Pendulispora brunnea]|uniref:VWA domain-containing protein n=1 Tax=Pendulispora brunnea TaxID=2905690 RepID=A0ABZ2JYN9_9BACT
MSKRVTAAAAAFLVSACTLVAACADDAGAPQDGNRGPDGGDSGNAPGPDGGSGIGDVDGGGPGGNDVCAHSEARASSVPVNAVFMLDRSGSMGDQPGGEQNRHTRWEPTKFALNSFFADSRTAGLKAALRDFPQMDATYPREPVCAPEAYEQPKVAMRPLPNNSSFKTAIENMGEPAGSSTVLSALRGALLHAKEIAATRPGERSVIVLVTDGLPDDPSPPRDACERAPYDDIRAAAKSAREQNPSISTYVVGVGTTRYRDQLDLVASAGGTERAFWIDVADPSKLTGELLARMKQAPTFSCSLDLPAPAPGKKLDFNAVQVTHTAGNGQTRTLAYSDACTGNQGWRYDNAQTPARIVLCTASCEAVQKDPAAKISIDARCTRP